MVQREGTIEGKRIKGESIGFDKWIDRVFLRKKDPVTPSPKGPAITARTDATESKTGDATETKPPAAVTATEPRVDIAAKTAEVAKTENPLIEPTAPVAAAKSRDIATKTAEVAEIENPAIGANPANVANSPDNPKPHVPRRFHSFWYVVELTVPFIDLEVRKYWEPNPDSRFRRQYVRAHIILCVVLDSILVGIAASAFKN